MNQDEPADTPQSKETNDQTGFSISNIVDAIHQNNDPVVKDEPADAKTNASLVKATITPTSTTTNTTSSAETLFKPKRSYKKRNTHINTMNLPLNNTATNRNHISHFGWIESQQQSQLNSSRKTLSHPTQETSLQYSFTPAHPNTANNNNKDPNCASQHKSKKNVFYSYMPPQQQQQRNPLNSAVVQQQIHPQYQQQQQQHPLPPNQPHAQQPPSPMIPFQITGAARAPVSFPSPFCNPSPPISSAVASSSSATSTTTTTSTPFTAQTPGNANNSGNDQQTLLQLQQHYPLSYTFGNPSFYQQPQPSFFYDSMENFSHQSHSSNNGGYNGTNGTGTPFYNNLHNNHHNHQQHHPSTPTTAATSNPNTITSSPPSSSLSSSVKFVNNTAELIHSQCKQQEDTTQRKKRTRTSAHQLEILQTSFNADPMPNSSGRMAIAKAVGMNARAVQVWFQNRRAKEKSDAQAKKLSFNLDPSETHGSSSSSLSSSVKDRHHHRSCISPRNSVSYISGSSTAAASAAAAASTTATAITTTMTNSNSSQMGNGSKSRSASLCFNSLPNYASSSILPPMSQQHPHQYQSYQFSRSTSPTPFCDLGLYFGGTNGGGGGGIIDPFSHHSMALNGGGGGGIINNLTAATHQPFIGNASLRQLRPLSPFAPSSPNNPAAVASMESSYDDSGVSSIKSLTRSSSPSTLLSSYLFNEDVTSPSYGIVMDDFNSSSAVASRSQSPQQQQQLHLRRQSLLQGGYHQGNCPRDDAVFSKPTGGDSFLPFPTNSNAAFDLLGRDIIPLRTKGGRSLSVPDAMHYRTSSSSSSSSSSSIATRITGLEEEEEEKEDDDHGHEHRDEEIYSRKITEKNAISSMAAPLDDISTYLDNSV